MTTLSTFPFDPGKLTIAPFKNGQCNEIALLISIFFWNCWNVHCLLPCEHILCLLLLDNIDLHIPYIIRSLVYPKGEQSQGEHIRMLIVSSDGTLCFGPIKYIKKIISAYESMFGEMPKLSSSPLEKNDHPELDTSGKVDGNVISKYQSMIGALQWTISLGRLILQLQS